MSSTPVIASSLPPPLPEAALAASKHRAANGPSRAAPKGAPAARAGAKAAPRPAPGGAALRRLPKAPSPGPWQPSPAASPAPAPGYAPAPAKASGEWAFLTDKKLSIEEKLARFAAKAMEKIDKDLEAKMAKYKADFTSQGSSSSSSTAKKGGTSLFDAVKSMVPAVGLAESLFGEAAFKKAASALGGPALAAAATGLGMPELAPLALKYGGDIAAMAFTDVGGSSSAAPSTAKEAGNPDEKMAMMEIQLLVEKQQRMFTAITNTLKALHDTQMAAVHNLR